MAQRSLATFLATLGGILVIVGGILGFLLSYGPYGYGPRFGLANVAVLAAVAVVLGLVILVYSSYSHLQGAHQNMTSGVALLVLGLVTWVIAGAWLLVAVGSFLTVMAGVVLLFGVFLHEAHVQTQST
jgi:hypothetical protein